MIQRNLERLEQLAGIKNRFNLEEMQANKPEEKYSTCSYAVEEWNVGKKC